MSLSDMEILQNFTRTERPVLHRFVTGLCREKVLAGFFGNSRRLAMSLERNVFQLCNLTDSPLLSLLP